MGAQYISFVTEQEPAKAFADRKAKDEYDYGHAGYTGTFAEVPSVRVLASPVFKRLGDAATYCEETSEKWGPALAVTFLDAMGKKRWLIAACASC